MTRIVLRLAILSAATFGAAGCALTDPYERAGVWHPRGSNSGNLAVMAADPNDLVIGRGVEGSNGVLAANAIERLYQDKVKPLPDSSLAIAPISTGGGGGNSGGGTGDSGGGGGAAAGGSGGSGGSGTQ